MTEDHPVDVARSTQSILEGIIERAQVVKSKGWGEGPMNFPALIFWLVILCSFCASPSTVLVLLLASLPSPVCHCSRPKSRWNVNFASDDVCRCFDPQGSFSSRDDAISEVLQCFAIAKSGVSGPIFVGRHSATLIMPRLFLGQSLYSRCEILG